MEAVRSSDISISTCKSTLPGRPILFDICTSSLISTENYIFPVVAIETTKLILPIEVRSHCNDISAPSHHSLKAVPKSAYTRTWTRKTCAKATGGSLTLTDRSSVPQTSPISLINPTLLRATFLITLTFSFLCCRFPTHKPFLALSREIGSCDADVLHLLLSVVRHQNSRRELRDCDLSSRQTVRPSEHQQCSLHAHGAATDKTTGCKSVTSLQSVVTFVTCPFESMKHAMKGSNVCASDVYPWPRLINKEVLFPSEKGIWMSKYVAQEQEMCIRVWITGNTGFCEYRKLSDWLKESQPCSWMLTSTWLHGAVSA
jgi:hypothetical protein